MAGGRFLHVRGYGKALMELTVVDFIKAKRNAGVCSAVAAISMYIIPPLSDSTITASLIYG